MAVFTGRRLYDNNVQGTTTDNPLTAGATTLNSAGLANLSAVSSNHAVIVLDPLRAAGAPEIVIVTAHTGAATSATITRGAYGTTARQHASGTLWVHPVTKDDLIQVLTANPSDNHEGQLWYRSDTDIYMAHNGSAAVEALPIGAWQTWTPTLFQNTQVTVTVTMAQYTRLGRLFVAVCNVAVTATGTSGQEIQIRGLPVTLGGTGRCGGSFRYFDSGNTIYAGTAINTGGNDRISFNVSGNGNAMGVNPTFAVASGDSLQAFLFGETA